MSKTLTPINAVDVLPNGTIRPITDPWPAAEPSDGALWRWLHCDRTGHGFASWSAAHLPKPALSGLLQVETRPRCDLAEGGLILNLRAINRNEGQIAEDMVSLRLWVTDRLVVTTRLRKLFVVEEMVAEMKAGRAPLNPGAFIARLTDGITKRIEQFTTDREEAVDAIEEVLLDNQPDRIGSGEIEIARISRSVIKLRRHIAPQREALARLATMDISSIPAGVRYELREAANRTTRTVEELDTIRERLASLRAHVDSLHAARMGRNGFILSIVAAIFLPLGFLTGLFGVNLAGMPGANWPWAFEALAVGVSVLGFGMWLFFRWMKWF